MQFNRLGTFGKWAAAGALTVSAVFAAASANAGPSWSVGIDLPVYQAQPPMYGPPAPPVYYRPSPAPAYYAPAPVAYESADGDGRRFYRHEWERERRERHREWEWAHRREGHDREWGWGRRDDEHQDRD